MRKTTEALPTPVGLVSIGLLVAAARWAHHWGTPSTDALVPAWAAAAFCALALPYHLRGRGIRFMRLGVALGLVSVLALVVAGIGWAGGFNMAGACGGG